MNKEILGLDNGYHFTKTSEQIKFLSTIREGHDEYNSDILEIEYEGINYIVGEPNGDYIVDADKFKTEEGKQLLKITTLTAIGLSYPGEKFIELIVSGGLPVAYYSKQKDDFLSLIKELDGSTFKINKIGFNQTIKIKDILVIPQSAGVVFEKNLGKETTIVIDIGGGTWDVSQFDGYKMVKKATYPEGMLILYSKIAQYLNSTYYTKYAASDIYNLINRGFFTVDGEKKSISVVDKMIEEHVSNVIASIKRDFELSSVDNVIGIGGGATELDKLLLKYIKQIEIEKDSDFSNANNFKTMAELKLSK